MSKANQQNNGRNGTASRARRRRQRSSAKKFWNAPAPERADDDEFWIAGDATALVRSLGDPPLPHQEAASTHYFEAVYQRAVGLAGALGTAAGLSGGTTDGDGDGE